MMAGRIKPAEAIAKIQKAADATAKDDSIKKYRHP
jgi:N-acetylglucosamine transport system substrate-binding protein